MCVISCVISYLQEEMGEMRVSFVYGGKETERGVFAPFSLGGCEGNTVATPALRHRDPPEMTLGRSWTWGAICSPEPLGLPAWRGANQGGS